ncbi:B3 domain-containing protein At2g33720-like [Gastrolobium bilobum]|uniref:B3 domain-containing protein At2g33720-like n=1 Tax=Gastrolobium bilobum TaxID=150636 RepID=UPI002AB1A585|nr:B3 domain-containing protein At2g33720-like [Gastrolobium bilobum]
MNNPADKREQCQKKRKSTSWEASSSSRRRFCSNKSEVSTILKLYDDPWTIKKTLTVSDLGILSRLLLGSYLVKKQILPMLDVDHARAAETEQGTPVRVRDIDTNSMHPLVLKRWSSSKSYVLIGKWKQDFVRRRELMKGDEIGFQWDPYNCIFNFCILKRAMRVTQSKC